VSGIEGLSREAILLRMVFAILPAVRNVSVDNSPYADHLIDSAGCGYFIDMQNPKITSYIPATAL
jgi:hypothetical protein